MLTHFSISQQGETHIESQKECQDRSGSVSVRNKAGGMQVVVAAAADGVGSCLKGGQGADIAVKCVTRKLARAVENCLELTDGVVYELLRQTFETACDVTEQVAVREDLPLTEYDTTLCAAVYDGTNLWYGQIGDSGIVAVYTDGTYEMCTPQQKGECANELIPLRVRQKWCFGRACKPVAAFAIMTDGVLNRVVRSEVYRYRVEYPVLVGPVLVDNVMHNQEEARQMRNQWDLFLKGKDPYAAHAFRLQVRDDISLVAVQNTHWLETLPEIRFDYEAFDEETRRVAQWRQAELDKAEQEYLARKAEQAAARASGRAQPRVVRTTRAVRRTDCTVRTATADFARNHEELMRCTSDLHRAAAAFAEQAAQELVSWLCPPEGK